MDLRMSDEAVAIAHEIQDLYKRFEETDTIEYHDYTAQMTQLALSLAEEVLQPS